MERNPEKKVQDWTPYYEHFADQPHEFLKDAIAKYFPNGGTALDIGAGNLRDTKLMLESGFAVLAVDPSTESSKLAEAIHNDKFTFKQEFAGMIKYPKEHFDLVNGQNILSLFEQERFAAILKAMLYTTKPGGMICLNFLGPNDDWNESGATMTFISRDEVQVLMPGFEIIEINEQEYDKARIMDQPHDTNKLKHWHTIEVLARKRAI